MESSEQQVSAAEAERMMKAQEVILKAAAGKLKWWEAAGIMGVTDRTMRCCPALSREAMRDRSRSLVCARFERAQILAANPSDFSLAGARHVLCMFW